MQENSEEHREKNNLAWKLSSTADTWVSRSWLSKVPGNNKAPIDCIWAEGNQLVRRICPGILSWVPGTCFKIWMLIKAWNKVWITRAGTVLMWTGAEISPTHPHQPVKDYFLFGLFDMSRREAWSGRSWEAFSLCNVATSLLFQHMLHRIEELKRNRSITTRIQPLSILWSIRESRGTGDHGGMKSL